MNKKSISIGIPAYNEESNITYLVTALLGQAQNLKDGVVKELIVISDGSTDKTVELLKKIRDDRLRIISHKQRQGKVRTQNQIFRIAKSDILVLFDADVLPTNEDLLAEIIQPILRNQKVGLTSADTVSAEPRSVLEKIISDSHELKKIIYKRLHKGNTIYLCHGRAQAFSKELYSNLILPEGYPEDAFAYLSCLQRKLVFVFVPKTQVTFRSPAVLQDHFKQSIRFRSGQGKLKELFGKEFVEEQYRIPFHLLVQAILQQWMSKPFSTTSYILITLGVNVRLLFKNEYQIRWQIATSSKKVL
jgi:glycosyltransferase involved in cell wall biosynthesis